MNRKSTIAFSLAPIIVSALGFIFTPVLSWWLAEDDMAKFAVFQTNANFFALFVGLGLDQALAREFHETHSPAQLLKRVLQLVAIAIPLGVVGLVLIRLNGSGVASASITAGMAAACVLMLLNRIYSSFIRMSGDGVAYAIDIVTPKVFQLLLIALICSQSIFVVTYDVVVGIVVASSAAALCYEIMKAGSIGREFARGAAARGGNPTPRAAALLKFSMPLVPGALAYYAISASAIYIVGAYGSARDVVTTSLAISVGGGLAVVQSVFTTLWAPFAYRWHARNGSADLYGQIATVVTMACAVILLASLFLTPYLPILFPEKYNGIARLLILVIVWNLLYLVSIVGSFGIGVKRMSLTSMCISLFGAALSIGSSIIACRAYGALGALLSVLGAFVVTLVLNCEVSSAGWKRVVGPQHYMMVAAMTASGVLFSLGLNGYAKILLAGAMALFVPAFRADFARIDALRKHPAPLPADVSSI